MDLTHNQRHHAHYHTAGDGHLYQGRFRSFPVQNDAHFLRLCRYVEANSLRARLVVRAERWRWSSLWQRTQGEVDEAVPLAAWPVACPGNWLELVNDTQPTGEVTDLRTCVVRGRPYGLPDWSEQTAKRLGLESALRERGRPRKG